MDDGVSCPTAIDDGLRQFLDAIDLRDKARPDDQILGNLFLVRDLFRCSTAHLAHLADRTGSHICYRISRRAFHWAVRPQQDHSDNIAGHVRGAVLDVISHPRARLAADAR